MPRAKLQDIAPATLIEADMSKGMVSDADPSVLSMGQVVNSVNYMLDKPGLAYKRGGSVESGDGSDIASGIQRVDVAEFPLANTSEYLAWGQDTKLYRRVAGVWTATSGNYGSDTGYMPRMKPAMVTSGNVSDTGGKMIWGTAAGTHPPRVYEGAGTAPRDINVATGLTADYGGRYMVFYKSRLALAASTQFENRMWFAPGPDSTTGEEQVETAWDLANAYIEFDHNITGLAALQNVMLVFSRNNVIRLTGSAPPPGGNMSQGPVADVGCTDSRSIRVWNDAAIWANPNGVYMSNGTGIIDLTLEGGFKREWQESVPSFSDDFMFTAGLYRNFYLVTVGNAHMFVLDIPRRVWWELTPDEYPNNYCADNLTGTNLYVSDGNTRVVDIASYFTPSASYRLDIGGDPPAATITTRIIHGGQVGVKAFRDGRLRYKLESDSSDATVDVSVTEANDGATVSSSTLGEFAGYDRDYFDISCDSEGIQVTVAQDDACDLFELYGMELNYRPLPLSRGGAL